MASQCRSGEREGLRLLLVVDEPACVSATRERIIPSAAAGGALDHALDHVAGLERALSQLCRERYDAVLLDVSARSVVGAVSRLQAAASEHPILVLTHEPDDEVAAAAVRLGAQDFVLLEGLSPSALDERIRLAKMRHGVLTRLREERAHAHRSSLHDALTGLPNRQHFLEQLERALAYAQRQGHSVAVLFIDLDRFKTINDTLGHAAGDKLLVEVAARLKPIIRRSDLLSRFGGDEFVALVQDANREGLGILARHLVDKLHEPHEIAGNRYWATASVGIAVGVGDELTCTELIRNADAAMYEAKSLGKNQFAFYSDVMGEAAKRRMKLEQRLGGAFHAGQLAVHFQPKVDLADGQIHGAEALLRWSDPELGSVSPGEFVHAAEENGLIVPMGHWVLEAACAEARRWHDDGFEISVTVNISAVQIQLEALQSSVAEALEKARLPACALELEVTESALMRDEERALTVLRGLRELGVSVSLDDFGTGYSALRNLRNFPVSAVKIDRSFIRDVIDDAGDAAIVSAILSMVQELGLRVVAEGVESEEQAQFLRDRGCVEAQGYLFGAALSADAFLDLLQRERAEHLLGSAEQT